MADKDKPQVIDAGAVTGPIAGPGGKKLSKGETRGKDEAKSVAPPKVDYGKIQGEREAKAKPSFFTIHKKGQGYWTRMGTAGVAVLIALLTSHFLYTNLGVWLRTNYSSSDDLVTRTANLAAISNAGLVAGFFAALELFLILAALGVNKIIGLVLSVGAAIGVRYLYIEGYLGAHNNAVPMGLVMGLVAGFVVGFGLLVYRIMNKPGNVDFLIATDSEMKKVNWTTRAELVGSTKVVIFFMFLIATLLFVIDTAFAELFHLINVLQSGPFG